MTISEKITLFLCMLFACFLPVQAADTNNDFWLDHAEELEMHFNAWVVR
ncbi:hypothetical protein [Pseudomonas protegens]|nr:hypothetical protein [Pseudomonas protegens]